MRIGIDATSIINRSGTGYYTQKLIQFLGRADSENEYVLFCPRGYQRRLERPDVFRYPNFSIEEVMAIGQVGQFIWKQFLLPKAARKYHLDLMHFPSFIASLQVDLPSILTVHDLCFFLFPETFSRLRRPYYNYMIPKSIGHCSSIIVDSQSTKKDLLKHMKEINGRIETVHLGVDPQTFFHVKNPAERKRIQEKYRLPDQFLLYVGTLEPRKNIPRLVRAFAYGIVAKGLPHHLVIAGRKGWLFGDIFKEVRSLDLKGRIHFPGFVEQADLASLYSSAQAFVYPSLYEGFGLPCLEAMSCGAPVIASGTSSLPEIVGDCALTVDPLSVDSIAEAMRSACINKDLRQCLSESGIRRASKFSWLTTAKKTVEVYLRTQREAE